MVGRSHSVSLEARMAVRGDWKEVGGSLDHERAYIRARRCEMLSV